MTIVHHYRSLKFTSITILLKFPNLRKVNQNHESSSLTREHSQVVSYWAVWVRRHAMVINPSFITVIKTIIYSKILPMVAIVLKITIIAREWFECLSAQKWLWGGCGSMPCHENHQVTLSLDVHPSPDALVGGRSPTVHPPALGMLGSPRLEPIRCSPPRVQQGGLATARGTHDGHQAPRFKTPWDGLLSASRSADLQMQRKMNHLTLLTCGWINF